MVPARGHPVHSRAVAEQGGQWCRLAAELVRGLVALGGQLKAVLLRWI